VLRDALHDHDVPRLREVAHKSCGMVSEFSSRADDLAGSLEELAAGAHLDRDQATVILQQVVRADGRAHCRCSAASDRGSGRNAVNLIAQAERTLSESGRKRRRRSHRWR